MKKFLFFASLLSLVTLSTFAGGVGVGNGDRAFRSPEGFAVTYPEKLTLNVLSDAAFRISNPEVVKSGGKVSSISFVVTKRAKTLAELAALVAREHPDLSFAAVKFPGAEGLFSEKRSIDTLNGFYFLLTSNGDLVEVTIEAYADGNGLAWVAPIVRTFAYDLTPPQFTAVRIPNRTWAAGSTQKVYFRAVDDNSGVLTDGFRFFALDRYDANGKPVYPGGIFGEVPFRAEGNDWYSLEIHVGRFLLPGTYTLGALDIVDRAHNNQTLYVENGFANFYSQKVGRQDIPVLRVTVTNNGSVDTTAPEFEGFRAESGVWEAGQAHRVYFRLQDDVSGIDVTKLDCQGLVGLEDLGGGHHGHADSCNNGRDEGGGWFSVEVKLGPNMPSGEYYLDGLEAADRAGNGVYLHTDYPFNGFSHVGGDNNKLKVPLWTVHVHNSGRVDSTPPKLEELRVDTTIWHTGETYRFRFRATDDFSGVSAGKHAYGYLVPSPYDDSSLRTIYLDQEIVAEGNDWYHLDVHVSAFLPASKYQLLYFSFSDRAGNGTGVECDLDVSKPCTNTAGLSIPNLTIEVVR